MSTRPLRSNKGQKPVSDVIQTMATSFTHVDLAHRRLRALFAASVGLSATEFNALMLIGDELGITPKQIAVELDITTGAVTAMTDRLVAADLIRREPNPNDRRSLLLHLTETGHSARDAMFGEYYRAMAAAVDAAPELLAPSTSKMLEATAAALLHAADDLSGVDPEPK
jgi:DNA-binding MarR family transcriptional regulator